MTDTETRIAIATACGWTEVHWYEDTAGPAMLVGAPPKNRPLRLGRPDRHVPDYLNSLDAMHEAEQTLSEEEHDEFSDYLLAIVAPDEHWSDALNVRGFVSATARQRAQAFVRTIAARAAKSFT